MRKRSRRWSTVSIVLGVLLAIAGLAVLAYAAAFAVALNQWGNSK